MLQGSELIDPVIELNQRAHVPLARRLKHIDAEFISGRHVVAVVVMLWQCELG